MLVLWLVGGGVDASPWLGSLVRWFVVVVVVVVLEGVGVRVLHQSLPLFSVEDRNSRLRMLKYTPDHMHCIATFYGPVTPPGTGILGFINAAPNQVMNDPSLRVGWGGWVLSLLESG